MATSIGQNDGSTHTHAAYLGGMQADGAIRFESCTSVEGRASISTGVVPAPTVVPVIFLPGIMGSNLKTKAAIQDSRGKVLVEVGEPIWRVDSGLGLVGDWATKKQDQYQLRLQHDKLTVDDRGAIKLNKKDGRTPMAGLTEAEARSRGWGSASAEFYGDFLDWLEATLNQPCVQQGDRPRDNPALVSLKQVVLRNPEGVPPEQGLAPLSEDDLRVLLKSYNPVHACGYNWLQSNTESGKELVACIDQVIKLYTDQKRVCKQVILVTHSMGGLVARAACMVHGASAKVAGVFHGVMPTDGAAAAYKRMVSGFGGEPSQGLFGWFTDWVAANALGPTGDYATPALALNAGPLELLPNARYNAGKPWLTVRDSSGAVLQSLPAKGDPYKEIYLESQGWWRLLNEAWLNPAGLKGKDFALEYEKSIGIAGKHHTKVQAAGDFHPVTHAHYGNDPDHKAYGTITWELRGTVSAQRNQQLQRERLEGVAEKTGTRIYLRDAEGGFHARLQPPDAPGDGTVPTQASARAVDKGVASGHVLARGSGYTHDASYAIGGPTEGPHAALQSIVRILQKVVPA